MNIGEKIETLIRCRCDGVFGKYLGHSAQTFGSCRIEGVVYKVVQNNESIVVPEFTVINVNEGTVAVAYDKFEIAMIKESDFS